MESWAGLKPTWECRLDCCCVWVKFSEWTRASVISERHGATEKDNHLYTCSLSSFTLILTACHHMTYSVLWALFWPSPSSLHTSQGQGIPLFLDGSPDPWTVPGTPMRNLVSRCWMKESNAASSPTWDKEGRAGSTGQPWGPIAGTHSSLPAASRLLCRETWP